MVTYLSIIGRLLRGLKVPVLFVGSGRGGRILLSKVISVRVTYCSTGYADL